MTPLIIMTVLEFSEFEKAAIRLMMSLLTSLMTSRMARLMAYDDAYACPCPLVKVLFALRVSFDAAPTDFTAARTHRWRSFARNVLTDWRTSLGLDCAVALNAILIFVHG